MREIFEVTSDNVRQYLQAHGLAQARDTCMVRELGGGVSNTVLLIECPKAPERRWVMKQALEKLRVKDDWRSDLNRIFREAEALQALRPVLGDSLPEVVNVDRENYLYIMTAAPRGCCAWKDLLLGGRCSEVATTAGALLGRLVSSSRQLHDLAQQLRTQFDDRTVFHQLRVDPYYSTTAERHPDVARQLRKLIDDSWSIRTSLVHGDYSPKNILVSGAEIRLIDFEVVHWGDPAFDSGFLLNHLFLKAFHQPQFVNVYLDAIWRFWRALQAGLGPQGGRDFERMTLRHLGGLMLARIDGKSPVEYIRDESTKRRVRAAAKRIICERPERIEDVIGLITE